MAGLWVANIDVTDDDEYAKYLEGSSDAVAAYGGTYIARAGRYEQKEGRDYSRNVIVRFDTYETAVEAYASDEYKAVLPHALAGSDRSFTIIEVED